MLLIVQAASVAVAAVIFHKTATETIPTKTGRWIALALPLTAGVREALRFDFHEVALGAPCSPCASEP